jgi:hypothetical protein
MSVAFLLVACCLEQSRAEILAQVLKNLGEQAPELRETLTVFDNASSVTGTIDVLRDCYTNVYQADKNVGYWSAIDWWLDHLKDDPPKYTYIIESDMIHYGFNRLWTCAAYLDKHPDMGSVRLHEYSVSKHHFYNKDAPRPESRRSIWQSHTNRVTGERVKLDRLEGDIWSTTFLTQLPALNRYSTMLEVFSELHKMPRFSEPDFQRLYWERYQRTAILDGGIFNCDFNRYGITVTGSWTDPGELKRLGYQQTRLASITPRDQYNVARV